MPDTDIQRHLLRESTDPSQALQTAINMVMAVLNQMIINSTNPISINSVQNTYISFAQLIVNNNKVQNSQSKISQANVTNVDKRCNPITNRAALH